MSEGRDLMHTEDSSARDCCEFVKIEIAIQCCKVTGHCYLYLKSGMSVKKLAKKSVFKIKLCYS